MEQNPIEVKGMSIKNAREAMISDIIEWQRSTGRGSWLVYSKILELKLCCCFKKKGIETNKTKLEGKFGNPHRVSFIITIEVRVTEDTTDLVQWETNEII